MSKKKQKSRKKLSPARKASLETVCLFNDATLHARRPLGATPPIKLRGHAPELRGSIVAHTLLCFCALGGVNARCLVAAALPRSQRTAPAHIREAHPEELESFTITNGVISADMRQKVAPST